MSFKYIDVSKHQGTIDFQKVKEAGIQGVILRCGYTGYGKTKSKQKDSKFEEYYIGFKSVGIPVGVYWYSCAVTEAEAKEEARLTLEYIKGKEINLPVYFDTEDNHDTSQYSPQSQKSIGKDALTKVTKAYCEAIESAGYYVGIYASKSWLLNQLDMNSLKDYDVWVAQYNSKCTYTGSYGMWQYTSTGKVNGIKGNVDLDHCYKDYVSIIKKAKLNYLEPITAPKEPEQPTTPVKPETPEKEPENVPETPKVEPTTPEATKDNLLTKIFSLLRELLEHILEYMKK